MFNVVHVVHCPYWNTSLRDPEDVLWLLEKVWQGHERDSREAGKRPDGALEPGGTLTQKSRARLSMKRGG